MGEAQLHEQELIVVAANPDPANGITVKPRLSEEFLAAVFGASVTHVKVTDLWAPGQALVPSDNVVSCSRAADEVSITLGKDKSSGGGVGIIMLTAA